MILRTRLRVIEPDGRVSRSRLTSPKTAVFRLESVKEGWTTRTTDPRTASPRLTTYLQP